MDYLNVWKQPIPTNLNQVFGENYLAKHLYIELLLRARNSDEEKEFAKRLHFLKKGQCVCGYRELAKEFGVDHKTIQKNLKKLENVYCKLELKSTNKGTVVTILNYEEVIKMERREELNWDSIGTQKGRNKSDKSEKSDKELFVRPKDKDSITWKEACKEYLYKLSEGTVIHDPKKYILGIYDNLIRDQKSSYKLGSQTKVRVKRFENEDLNKYG